MSNLEEIPDYIWYWLCDAVCSGEVDGDGVFRFPEGELIWWQGRITWVPSEPREGPNLY